jgi:predicted transcriptional regulator
VFRRARAWASTEISRLLHAEVVEARAEIETSVQARVDDLATGLDRDARAREQSLSESLDRVATALDAIAEQLAADARDHRASLAAVEFVAREMALAFIRPAGPGVATVLGGTIEPHTVDLTFDALAHAEVQPRDGMGPQAIAAPTGESRESDDIELRPGCIVEVRSRFQNRWVDGFEVVEIVERDGIEHYRLARHADHVQLPVLFDACDLRPLDVVGEIVIDAVAEDGVSAVLDDPGSRR